MTQLKKCHNFDELMVKREREREKREGNKRERKSARIVKKKKYNQNYKDIFKY